jgi:hypothetical protein
MGRYDVRNKAFSDSGAVAESKLTWFLQEYSANSIFSVTEIRRIAQSGMAQELNKPFQQYIKI